MIWIDAAECGLLQEIGRYTEIDRKLYMLEHNCKNPVSFRDEHHEYTRIDEEISFDHEVTSRTKKVGAALSSIK